MLINTIKMCHLQIGEAGKLKPLEVDLKRLEDISDSIVQDFAAMRKREEEMRSTNGKTHRRTNIVQLLSNQTKSNVCLFFWFPESTTNRVLFFSIFSMCCLLGLATWQVLYLRRFFKAKKLIE